MNNVQGEELGELVKKLMNDPQVAEIVRNLRESGAADEAKKAAGAALTEQAAQTGGIGDALAPLLGTLTGATPTRTETENRNRLLAALKPYLSPERRELPDREAAGRCVPENCHRCTVILRPLRRCGNGAAFINAAEQNVCILLCSHEFRKGRIQIRIRYVFLKAVFGNKMQTAVELCAFGARNAEIENDVI